jgi:hypothetical protein
MIFLVKNWTEKHEMKGTHQTLLKELQFKSMKCYIKYLRLDDERFQVMVSKVSHFIAKQSTHLINPITMEGHLMITLQFLATVKVFQAFSSVPGYHNALIQT